MESESAPASSPIVKLVEDVENILIYKFGNKSLLLEALKTAGSGFNIGQSRAVMDGNKRLALVGDSAIKMVVLCEWYHSGGNKGSFETPFMTKLIVTEAVGNKKIS